MARTTAYPDVDEDEAPPDAVLDPDDPLPPDDDDEDGDDDDGEDRGPWVTVATFWQPPAAHVARLRLEGADVPCVLLDENLIATDWLFANAVGGIKLQVPAAHAIRARALLYTPREGRAEAAAEPLYDGQARCPSCGSDRLHTERLSRRLVFLSILLLGAPLPIFARHVRCEDCGATWKRD